MPCQRAASGRSALIFFWCPTKHFPNFGEHLLLRHMVKVSSFVHEVRTEISQACSEMADRNGELPLSEQG